MDKFSSIAAVVLTLNEEHNLSRALRSLAWCDELLVLDSGSIDSTEAVARQNNAKFIVHKQSRPFQITEQRNWALDRCGLRSKWVLFIDADEEVSPALAKEIHKLISAPSRFNSYELTPRYWFLGKWLKRTQGFPNWHPRLLQREVVRFQGGVWESFSDTALTSRIYIPYEHFAFSKGIDDWLERHQRYSSWDAIEIDQYLSTKTLHSIRKRRLRAFTSYLWPLRPLLRFIQKYLFQFGFLEGWQALLYCLLICFYDLMTITKLIQLRRHRAGLPL